MINYASKQKNAKHQMQSGSFDTPISILVKDSKDAYGQQVNKTLITTRGNITILEADDQTDLTRVVRVTVYLKAIEPLMAERPERAFISVGSGAYIDIADITSSGVYAIIRGVEVVR